MSEPVRKHILLKNNTAILKGNAAYIYEFLAGDGQGSRERKAQDTYLKFLKAESCIRTDPQASYGLLRKVIEDIAYDAEASRRISEGAGESQYNDLWKQAKKNEFPKNPDEKKSCKDIIHDTIISYDNDIRENQANGQYSSKALGKSVQKCIDAGISVYKKSASNLVNGLYKAACDGAHTGNDFSSPKTDQKTDALIQGVFYLAQFLKNRNTDIRFRKDIMPFGRYFPVLKEDYSDLGLEGYDDYGFYVSEDGGPVRWHILKCCRDNDDRSRRDAASLERLWNAGRNNPRSVLRPVGKERIHNFDETIYIYDIPGEPAAFAGDVISRLSLDEKYGLAAGLASGISSLHGMEPPMPHRSLSPQELLICTQGGYVNPLIIDFDTVKDFSDGARTMRSLLLKKSRSGASPYLAPELSAGDPPAEKPADLAKADIFSLGRLLELVFEKELAGRDDWLSWQLRTLAGEMTDPDISERPDIGQVRARLRHIFSNKPVCHVATCIGSRRQQQDGIYVRGMGPVMEDNYTGTAFPDLPAVLAVFDGMVSGEDTANVVRRLLDAAGSFSDSMAGKIRLDYTIECKSFAESLEKTILEYKKEHGLFEAGSTVALAVITPDKVTVMNIGDSRVYLLHGNNFKQLSEDHCFSYPSGKSSQLFQYIGVTSTGVQLRPYICTEKMDAEDRVLLCSDGLSGKLGDEEIRRCISGVPLKTASDRLLSCISGEGQSDNVSFILFGCQLPTT